MTKAILAACVAAVAFDGSAADWPQWGGQPVRNMYSPERGLPGALGEVKFKPGGNDIDTSAMKNLKWVAKLGSQSYGNVTVSGGKVFIEQRYLQTILESAGQQPSAARFTARERDVMRLLLEGCSNKEIGAELGVSESAVKASLQQLFAKTGVRTRSQLVRVALERRDAI